MPPDETLHLKSEVSGALELDGLPSKYSFAFESLPQISIRSEPVRFEPIRIEPIRIEPMEIRFAQWPSVRVHLPADYTVGLSVFGHEILRVRLCGEGQAISEPYVPGPCEGSL